MKKKKQATGSNPQVDRHGLNLVDDAQVALEGRLNALVPELLIFRAHAEPHVLRQVVQRIKPLDILGPLSAVASQETV